MLYRVFFSLSLLPGFFTQEEDACVWGCVCVCVSAMDKQERLTTLSASLSWR